MDKTDFRLSVITACVFDTEQPIWRLRSTCDRFGIPLHPYGLTTPEKKAYYGGWVDIKINRLLAAVKEQKALGATHILYTDGRDSFFLTGLAEIESKFLHIEDGDKLGCLMATETDCYPYPSIAERFPDPGHRYRWIGAGQFLASVDWLIWAWEMMIVRYGGNGPDALHEDNDQAWLSMAFVDGALSSEEHGVFLLDTGCEIFQSAGNSDCRIGHELEVREASWIGDTGQQVSVIKRIYNTVTGSWPNVLHYNGGYSSVENGKDEAMSPGWRALGY